MDFPSRLKETLADFLFPKDAHVVKLESISTEKLSEMLSAAPARNNDDMSLLDYGNSLTKEMIWELKYEGNRTVAEKFGEVLHDALMGEIEERRLFESSRWQQKEEILLVPVPISDKRRFERGWNQSELLSEAIMRNDGAGIFKYLPRQLVKTRNTESQTKTSSKRERLENVRNSMKVLNPSSVSGRFVVVIDDVTTTGATFSEAKRALREAGAGKVFCTAMAH